MLDFYFENTNIKVGNRERIHFWTDLWWNSCRLSEEFPRLFSLSMENEGSLMHYNLSRARIGKWNLVFRRGLRAWEEVEVNRLYEWLSVVPIIGGNLADHLRWELDPSGQFSVASVWKWFQVAKGSKSRVMNELWQTVTPPKIQFFGWLAWREKVKNSDFLQRIEVLGVNATTHCVFCKPKIESVNHVLLHFPLI